MKKIKLILIVLIAGLRFGSAQNIQVHDPVMIRENGTYYLFCTGMGISVWYSHDMTDWKREEPVFKKAPAWAIEAVPGFKGHIWAPDISWHNNRFYLFYSISAFGKNTSCIALATNSTLDPSSPDFKWVDHGKIVQSYPNRDFWNAIDPNLIVDDNNDGWLTFGSFWGGIKMVKMNDDLMTIDSSQIWYTLSKRQRTYDLEDDNPGDGAVEAPFIFRKGDYYYLFVSHDFCCRGLESNYKMIVGRSDKVTGPYIDKHGIRLTAGGGTVLMSGNDNWSGVGHNGICSDNGKDFIVFHGYDVSDNGKPKLLIREIKWTEDFWPEVTLE